MAFSTGSTEQMRIDASGNIGIGTTTTTERVRIQSADNYQFSFRNNSASGLGAFGLDSSNNLLIYGNTAERMRISSSGKVGIGNSSPTRTLDLGDGTATANAEINSSSSPNFLISRANVEVGYIGTTLWNTGSGSDTELSIRGKTAVGFVISSSEKARIDSSGNLLVGTTTEPSSSGSGSGFVDTSFGRNQLRFAHTDNTGSSRSFLVFYGGTAGNSVGTITASNTTTTYNTTSDQRLKENIVDAPAGNIDAIRVRSFDWKADGAHQTYGMVAQELVDVAPEAVTQGETEDDMWAVDYSKLVPMMIKEIQDLKAEVAALKGA